jgi:hypothetical protein
MDVHTVDISWLISTVMWATQQESCHLEMVGIPPIQIVMIWGYKKWHWVSHINCTYIIIMVVNEQIHYSDYSQLHTINVGNNIIHNYIQLLFHHFFNRWYSQVFSSTLAGEIPIQCLLPGLVNVYIANWKDPPFSMGKLAINGHFQ